MLAYDISAGAKRLGDSALTVARQDGFSAITFRSLAETANVSVASLQTRFGTKDGILDLAFAAVADSEIRRIDTLASTVAAIPISPQSGRILFGTVIQEQCSAGSPNQPILIEMLVESLRDSGAKSHVRRWLSRVERFWSDRYRVHPDPDAFGRFLMEFQIGLTMTTACCRRPVETGLANDDLIERVLGTGRDRDPLWYRALLAGAIDLERGLPVDDAMRSEMRERLLTAGAEVVAAQGARALSYRSVAARAAISPSAVTHYFPKREALIYSVYRRIYEEIAFDAEGMSFISHSRDPEIVAQSYVDIILKRKFAGVCQPVAHAELYLLAARNEGLADLAWHMRMTRGIYWMEKARPGGLADRDAFDAHAVAIWGLGCSLAHLASEQGAGIENALRRSIAFGINVFERGPAFPAAI
jgi:AcrR family transcriptional regulator